MSEDRKHTSDGVFAAVDNNLGAVVGEEEGAVVSIPDNEGRITQAWVNVRGGLRARVTRHSWLVACDADTSSVEFQKRLLVSGGTRCMW